MKVLFTITYYHPYISGLTIAASRFAEGLVANGHRVTVLAMQHDRRLPETETIHRVRVRRASWQFKISKGFFSIAWLTESWRLIRDHDVVVVNLPQFEGIVPALLAKLMGKRLIAIYHCEVVLPEGFTNNMVQSLLEVSNMTTMGLSDRVVTYTSDYARSSKLLRHVRHKLAYIVPPIPMLKVSMSLKKKLWAKIASSAIRRRGGIGAAKAVIGVSARLSVEKGIEYLIAAMPFLQKNFPGVKIAVAGPMDPVGESSYKHRIMKLVKTHNKHITFLGEIEPRMMGSFYRLLDVLVLPSVNRTEAFGMVQVEAMRMGIPVVASDLPGVRVPIIKTGMGLLVPPKDPRALAGAIGAILTHREKYVKNQEAVESAFSAKKSLEAFLKLL